jgi:hypothetical protein
MNTANFIPVIFFSAGLVFFGVGFYLKRKTYRITRNGIKTEAEIIKTRYDSGTDGQRLYRYKLRYQDYLGKIIEKEMSESVSIKKREGEFIEITYSQENTDEFVAFQWLFDILGYGFMLFGITFIAVKVIIVALGKEKITIFLKSIL